MWVFLYMLCSVSTADSAGRCDAAAAENRIRYSILIAGLQSATPQPGHLEWFRKKSRANHRRLTPKMWSYNSPVFVFKNIPSGAEWKVRKDTDFGDPNLNIERAALDKSPGDEGASESPLPLPRIWWDQKPLGRALDGVGSVIHVTVVASYQFYIAIPFGHTGDSKETKLCVWLDLWRHSYPGIIMCQVILIVNA